jgi:hypothetical protein
MLPIALLSLATWAAAAPIAISSGDRVLVSSGGAFWTRASFILNFTEGYSDMSILRSTVERFSPSSTSQILRAIFPTLQDSSLIKLRVSPILSAGGMVFSVRVDGLAQLTFTSGLLAPAISAAIVSASETVPFFDAVIKPHLDSFASALVSSRTGNVSSSVFSAIATVALADLSTVAFSLSPSMSPLPSATPFPSWIFRTVRCIVPIVVTVDAPATNSTAELVDVFFRLGGPLFQAWFNAGYFLQDRPTLRVAACEVIGAGGTPYDDVDWDGSYGNSAFNVTVVLEMHWPVSSRYVFGDTLESILFRMAQVFNDESTVSWPRSLRMSPIQGWPRCDGFMSVYAVSSALSSLAVE